MSGYYSVQGLVDRALKCGKKIYEIVLEDQCTELGQSKQELVEEMTFNFRIMQEAVSSGLAPGMRSPSGLSGGDACRMKQAMDMGITLGGDVLDRVLVKALAIAEVNACMGRIVAAPTAGSCGILPSTLLAVMETKNLPEGTVVMGLFTAAGIGMAIAQQASISGAECGCQAECGAASAMAAAALVEISGGTPQMAANACAIALKSVIGLVCDPVAGLVEVPCIKRNAIGAANALAAADMALAGIESVIPADEVIWAMKSVGSLMCPALKETSEGGLADTPTARRLERQIFSR